MIFLKFIKKYSYYIGAISAFPLVYIFAPPLENAFGSFFLDIVSIVCVIFLLPYGISHFLNLELDEFALVILLINMIATIWTFSFIFQRYGLYNGDGDLITDKITCLYFSIVTWTTLGYGDLRPSLDSRFYAAIEALLGYIYMGILVGLAYTIISKPKKQKATSTLIEK